MIQYHIATGAELKRVRIDAGTVWGLCIQREYTAGINTCYDFDAFGNALDSDNDGVFGEEAVPDSPELQRHRQHDG